MVGANNRMAQQVEAAIARLQEARRQHPERFPDPERSASKEADRVRKELLAHGVPSEYVEGDWAQVDMLELADWKVPELVAAKLRRGHGLFLFGPVGTGKSTIAALCCGEVVKLGRTVRWEYLPTLIDELNQGRAASLAVQARCRRPSLLVLDDFGVANLAPWEITELDKIVEARYSRNRSTIITTNIDPAVLAQDRAFGRIVSRWRQVNQGLIVSGPDRRKPEL